MTSPVRITTGLPAGPERPGTAYDVVTPDDTGRILRRRKWTIIFLVVLGGLAGFGFSLLQPPVYQSMASIEVKDLNQDFMNGREVNPVAEADPRFGAQNDVETQIRILESRNLLERALRSAGIAPPAGSNELQKELWLAKLAEQVKVRLSGQTRIVEVQVDAETPRAAADLANELCRTYIEQSNAARAAVSSQTTEGLTVQLDEMRDKLMQSEDALQDYARAAKLLITGDRQNVAEEKLRQLQADLTQAQSDLALKQGRWEMAQGVPPESVPEVLDDNEYREVSTKLAEMKSQEAQLDATFQPEFRKNTQLHAAVVSLEATALAKRTALVARVHNEFLAAQGRERLLAQQYARQVGLVSHDSDSAVRYNQLRRDVEANQQLYQTMVQKVRESGVASTIPPANVRIIDAAQPAPKPYKPRTAINTLVALTTGLVFAVALVMLQERTNNTIREAGVAPALLQLPELGVIPRMSGARLGGGRSRERMPAMTSLAGEGYRSAAASVLFAAGSPRADKTGGAVLVVTSGAADEGKTSVCCGLASALTERGLRVLILDADLRRPRVHVCFKSLKDRNELGLIHLLEQGPADADSVRSAVQWTGTNGLFVLPSGGVTTSDAGLLGSPQMAEVLRHLRPEYDMILIDTPPLLGLPSARILGRLSDGVILVLRAGKTTRNAALAATERLADDEITVTGTILTDFDPKFSPDGPYSRGAYR